MRSLSIFFSRLVLTFLLVFGMGLSLARQVEAKDPCDPPIDNDCGTIKVCQLTIGATLVGVDEATKKDIYYTRKVGNKYYYKVVACGLDPVVTTCTTSGQNVVLAWQANWAPYWSYLTLTKNGSCYEGEIESSTAAEKDAQFDIEINDAGGACANKQPMCRRAYGVMHSTSANDLQKCTAASDALKTCSAVNFQTKQLVVNQPVTFSVDIDPILGTDSCELKSGHAIVSLDDPNGDSILSENIKADDYGTKSFTFTPTIVSACGSGSYKLTVETFLGNGTTVVTTCPVTFDVGTDSANACEAPEPKVNVAEKFQICDQIKKDTKNYERCIACMAGDVNGAVPVEMPDAPQGIWTAVGCIKTDPQSIILAFIKIGLGIAGGGALLMILAASFIISTSAGDAKKFTEAREMISNAVIGLVFIIMSITILQFIGVTLFHIPGFGE